MEINELQKEIVDSVTKPHGRLLLSPRIGKTKICIDIIKKFKPDSILWVTPSKKLADVDIPEEFITWKAEEYKKILTTVTWKSLENMKGHYDLIILDEEQKITINNVKNILNKSLTYNNIISMTGTPTKNSLKKYLYYKLELGIIKEISLNSAVDLGVLADYTINVVSIEMSSEKTVETKSKSYNFKTSEIDNYNYLNSVVNSHKGKAPMFNILNRMRAIHNSPSKLKVAKHLFNTLEGRKIFFCANIQQAESITKNVFHSKTDDKSLSDFVSGNIQTIAMVNSGGIGFTYKEIDHLILVQSDSDTNGESSQKLARTLLNQNNYKAKIWVLCLKSTQDEKWVESMLNSFDKQKINYINLKL